MTWLLNLNIDTSILHIKTHFLFETIDGCKCWNQMTAVTFSLGVKYNNKNSHCSLHFQEKMGIINLLGRWFINEIIREMSEWLQDFIRPDRVAWTLVESL